MAVADVYDALRSQRCYKEAQSHEESCDIIVQGSGNHFDPEVVRAFCNVREACKQVSEQLA
jgi:putative two-component system response regulator